jgi:GTP-binding protein
MNEKAEAEETTSPFDVLDASFIAAAGPTGSLPPPTLAEVAFAGRSNVGKSSMMNALMQRRGLVRTSSTPGYTRTVNQFGVRTRGGLDLLLVDLPGYGFAKRSKTEKKQWGPLLEGYLLGRPSLRLVVLLVDIRRGLEDDDWELLEFCEQPRPGNAPLATAVVATKLDLLPKNKRKPALADLHQRSKRPVLGISAETGEGRLAVWKLIARTVTGAE